MNRALRPVLFTTAAALLASGCNRNDVHVSLQPKEASPEQVTAAAESSEPPHSSERPHPHLTWTLPPGWTEGSTGQMSVASFDIKTDAGQATVNITPLPNLAGKEALIVNMWRQQVGAEPLDPAEATKGLTEVPIADGKGQLFEIEGTSEGKPLRIITAMAHAADASWFYKLSGDPVVVEAQKPAFLEFLKSVRMQQGAAGSTTPSGPAVNRS